MKILLMGNPNVGKSVFFNRLTGAKVTVSNYPGTTVDYSKGYMRLEDEDFEVIDVPGTFSLEPRDKAEEVAVKMFRENKDSVIIIVIDSVKLERGLYLTLEIIEEGYPVIIALNMWDIAKRKNIQIDVEKLKDILGVPIIPTVAVSGKGIKKLASEIKRAFPADINKIVEMVGGIA
ncbi:MAG: FeoB small GTPase domain-containing protein [Candidatus Heimdallarchaeaceae archaeon]